MGKVKKNRLRALRFSPTCVYRNGTIAKHSNVLSKNIGLDSSQIPEISNDASISSDTEMGTSSSVLNVKGGLKTAHEMIMCDDDDQRMIGLNMLASLALECKAAEEIVEKRLPSLIVEFLKDSNIQVKLAAVGALGNITSWGSEEIIDGVIQQDCLQAVTELVKAYDSILTSLETPFNSFQDLSKGIAHITDKPDSQPLIFIHATNIILTLCECSEDALVVFNREGLIDVFLKHINPFEWGYPIALAVAYCLLCVSENNTKIGSSILPVAETIFSLISKSIAKPIDAFGLHFSVVMTGVLLNVSYWEPGDTNFRLVFEVLSQVLEVNTVSLPETPFFNGKPKMSTFEQMEHVISAQLVAFEILCNICCPDGSEDQEEEEEEDQLTDDECMEVEDKVNPDCILPEVIECIQFFELIDKARNKIVLQPTKELDNQEENEKILQKFAQLKIRGLQCFQNLVDSLPIEALGSLSSLYSIWSDLGKMFSTSTQTDIHLLEAVSGTMRAVAEKVSDNNCSLIYNTSQNDIKILFETGVSCESESVRANLCRMVGSLGCAFIKHTPERELDSSSEINGHLSSMIQFLLQVGREDRVLWVRAEAIDVIIDLFSEDKTDGLAFSVCLIDRLREILPLFKAEFNQHRKSLGCHRALVLTVRDNLASFITYKSPRAAKRSHRVAV